MRRYLLIACLLALPLLRAQDGDNGPWQSCWGSKTEKCPDGRFHDSRGNVQPDVCSNAMMNMDGTPNAHMHDCKCAIATTDADHCPPEGIARTYQGMGAQCSTECRDNACKCVNLCDQAADSDKPVPPKGKKVAPKKGKGK